MGIEACVIIENRLTADKFRMLADQLSANTQLAKCMREFDTAMRAYNPQVRAELHAEPWLFHEIERWVVEGGWDAGCRGKCKGPFGNLDLYDNLAKLDWYWCRWSVFLEDMQFRKPLYEATQIISNILNRGAASTAIFLPDSGAYNATRVFDELHRTMPGALTVLNKQCCPPAKSLEAIANVPREGYYDGYYVTQWPDFASSNNAKSES
jgi:hypothetical protein